MLKRACMTIDDAKQDDIVIHTIYVESWAHGDSVLIILRTHSLTVCSSDTVRSVSIFVISLLRFFFFQAEDGIRDLTVTGVQTCALPISWSSWPWVTTANCCGRRPA